MIFVDTSAFLAIENNRDQHHRKALALRDALLKSGEILVTSDYILDESYTIIRFRAGHFTAVQFGEAVHTSRFVQVESVTSDLVEKAWKIFKSYSDHAFSFTDCTSLVLMDHLKLKKAFSFDVHFREYGNFLVTP